MHVSSFACVAVCLLGAQVLTLENKSDLQTQRVAPWLRPGSTSGALEGSITGGEFQRFPPAAHGAAPLPPALEMLSR